MSDYCDGVVSSRLTMEAKWVTSYANSRVNVVGHGDDLLMLVGLSVRLPNQDVQAEDAATTS